MRFKASMAGFFLDQFVGVKFVRASTKEIEANLGPCMAGNVDT